MKLIQTICFAAILLTSCASHKHAQTTATASNSTASASKTVSGDGSSFEKAIFIDKTTEGPGVQAEYDWLKQNYPGYTMLKQSLNHYNGKSYDILTIKTASGETKNIYFDISNFFGKF